MNGCCANLRMFVAVRVLTLRTFLYTYIYSQVFVYMYCMMYSFVSEPMLCEIPFVCTLASAHTLNLSVCIHISKFTHILHVIDTFVYEPMLCELTYVSSLASLHFEAASYTSTYLQIYICHSIDTRVRIWAHAVQTHICFCPCERSHLEPLCIHQFYLKCTYFLS